MEKHKHHDLIVAWAGGAQIQAKAPFGEWNDIPKPQWNEGTEYRIKPEESTTVEPEHGRTYWWLNRQGDPVPSIFDEMCDSKVLNYGNCFRTPEAAEEAAQLVKTLLLAIRENKPFSWNCENDTADVKENLTSEIDGKPMTETEKQIVRDYRLSAASDGKLGLYSATKGEYALIEALRDFAIRNVFEQDESILVHAPSPLNIQDTTTHIAFWSDETTPEQEERVRNALKQIQQEQLEALF